MSHRILSDPDAPRNLADDLESFFYVFLYICTMFNGPRLGQKKENIPFFICTWLYEPIMEKIGQAKYAICSSPLEKFRSDIIVHVQPYFKEFIPCLEGLQQLFYRREKNPDDPACLPPRRWLFCVVHVLPCSIKPPIKVV